ncbi:ComEC/Rec2 family competence protein [Ectobacillus polymachus]|uniref:ComEC/Rec2 family competence protein n=1 Tax=Ectobacillus polymachus TaxID=1508806 RepID=UPI003A888F0D
MKKTQVYFLNVGWGDAHFIVHPSGRLTLIDGGDADPSQQEDYPLSWMDRHGFDTLDYMILTHLHDDHMNGLLDVVRHKNVLRAVLPYEPFTLPELATEATQNNAVALQAYLLLKRYIEFINLLNEHHVTIIWRREFKKTGQIVWDEKGVTLNHLYPSIHDPLPAHQALEYLLENLKEQQTLKEVEQQLTHFFHLSNHDSSVFLLVDEQEKDKGVLFGGDLMKEEWEILCRNPHLKAKVWKAPHHGLDDACTIETLRNLHPAHVIIPVCTARSGRQLKIWKTLMEAVDIELDLTGNYDKGSYRKLEGPIEVFIGSK